MPRHVLLVLLWREGDVYNHRYTTILVINIQLAFGRRAPENDGSLYSWFSCGGKKMYA